ncbi:MAG: hypothetical protein O3A51_04245 [Verrucomicrobia bacterium]|nr:hypothetical protein [Verrucomicrobiota bacterium]
MKTTTTIGLVGVIAIGTWVGLARAGEHHGREEFEMEVPVKDVPEVVMDAAQKALPGLRVLEAEVEKERYGLVYGLEGVLGDEKVELEVSADGRFVEMEIPVAELPGPVSAAVRLAHPGIRLLEAEIRTSTNGSTYEVEGVMDDDTVYELCLRPDGYVISDKED